MIDAHTNELGRLDNVGRTVANTKRELLAKLDAANPEYAAARALYGTASDAIDSIINGKAGDIAKMDGQAAQSMVNRAFSAKSILPEQMHRMRGQFSMAGKMDEFNAGLSSFLGDKLDDAMKILASGKTGNVAGKFQTSVWGDPRQQEIIRAALGDPARADGFAKFMEVLRRAGSSLAEGSPTATDLGAPSLADRGMASKLLRQATNPLKWSESAVDGYNALRDPARRRAFAETMLGGNYDTELKKLRLVSPVAPQSIATVSRILEAWALSPEAADAAAPEWQRQNQR